MTVKQMQEKAQRELAELSDQVNYCWDESTLGRSCNSISGGQICVGRSTLRQRTGYSTFTVAQPYPENNKPRGLFLVISVVKSLIAISAGYDTPAAWWMMAFGKNIDRLGRTGHFVLSTT